MKHNVNSYSSSLVSAGHEDVVRELVGAGADVNRKNDKGITPLLVHNVPVGGSSLLV